MRRLERALEMLGSSPKGKTCDGMKGLLSEGSETMKEAQKGEVRDAALIGSAQRVEHYEMAVYGTVHAFAERLKQKEIAQLLAETIEEEKAADRKLTDISKKVNQQALDAA